MSAFTREYTAYASYHGRTVPEQLDQDALDWPGGVLCGFICWMSKMLAKFKKENPEAFIGHWVYDHDKKIEYLEKQAQERFMV